MGAADCIYFLLSWITDESVTCNLLKILHSAQTIHIKSDLAYHKLIGFADIELQGIVFAPYD